LEKEMNDDEFLICNLRKSCFDLVGFEVEVVKVDMLMDGFLDDGINRNNRYKYAFLEIFFY
jgi:hypothetical protein